MKEDDFPRGKRVQQKYDYVSLKAQYLVENGMWCPKLLSTKWNEM